MKLINILDELRDNVNVYCYVNNELVTYYDGRNAIDESYNNALVESVHMEDDNNLVVTVK